MDAVLIDKNFEFRPANMTSYVKGSIGVVCATDEELTFLVQHLQKLDLPAELQAHLFKKHTQPNPNKPKLKLLSDKDKEKKNEIKENGMGTISSLELD